ncbi:MAG: adenine phosphoribosyltransferase [Actinomycetia bacterium]|nr:adenine phosphoribosyltransferase [Actinomycetes bacterium]MCH9699807.1 adenine phosphoribosyltransferase [Actinomycetes bacterium]MCH9761550.1 adenine phosphoribosyltransferase [Actinomycetes bacterium]
MSTGAGPPATSDTGAGPSATSGDVSHVIASLLREVPDFPEPGIQFKDLTPVLADARGLAEVSDAIADRARGVDLVAGVDARGFLLGGAVALKLGIGVVAVRKGGKLPPPVFSKTYTLEYGTATLEVPADGIDLAGRSIVVIDDVLATGGTLAATNQLLTSAGARVTGAVVMLELAALGGRALLDPLSVVSLYAV